MPFWCACARGWGGERTEQCCPKSFAKHGERILSFHHKEMINDGSKKCVYPGWNVTLWMKYYPVPHLSVQSSCLVSNNWYATVVVFWMSGRMDALRRWGDSRWKTIWVWTELSRRSGRAKTPDADAENALQEVEGLRNDKRRDTEHRGQGFLFQHFSSSSALVM